MSKNSESRQQARFDTRLTKSQKEYFERAASLGGYKTLSAFMLHSAQEKAKAIIEEHNNFLKSEQDREIFFNALLDDSEPNEALIDAAQDYKEKLEKK